MKVEKDVKTLKGIRKVSSKKYQPSPTNKQKTKDVGRKREDRVRVPDQGSTTGGKRRPGTGPLAGCTKGLCGTLGKKEGVLKTSCVMAFKKRVDGGTQGRRPREGQEEPEAGIISIAQVGFTSPLGGENKRGAFSKDGR